VRQGQEPESELNLHAKTNVDLNSDPPELVDATEPVDAIAPQPAPSLGRRIRDRRRALKRRMSLQRFLRQRPEVIGGGVITVLGLWFALSLAHRYFTAELRTVVRMIPEDAMLAASLSVQPEDWQQVQSYGTPESQAVLQDQLQTAAATLFNQTGFKFETDIRPWLGSRVFFAMLPPLPLSNDMAPTKVEIDYSPVIFLPIENLRRARQQLQAKATGATWTERVHSGVSIRETEDLSAAILGQVLVVSPDPSAIDRTIDASKSEKTILNAPGYQDTWKILQGDASFGAVYFNVARALDFSASRSLNPTSESAIDQVQTQGSMAVLFLQPQAIEIQGLSWLKPQAARRYQQDLPTPKLAETLPAQTIAALVGLDFQQVWQDYLQGTQANALLPLDPEWLRSALTLTTNLDLESDVVSWMKGEFAIAAVPYLANGAASSEPASPQGAQETDPASDVPSNTLPLGITILSEAHDPKPADRLFEHLDRTVAERYGIEVAQETIGDRQVVRWTPRQQGLTIEHGWLSRTMTFFSVGAPIAESLLQPEQTLSNSPRFRQAFGSNGLNRRNGFFYLDMTGLLTQGGLNQLRLPPDQLAILQAIDRLGVTGGIYDERRTRYDITVHFTVPPAAAPSTGTPIAPQTAPQTAPEAAPSSELPATP